MSENQGIELGANLIRNGRLLAEGYITCECAPPYHKRPTLNTNGYMRCGQLTPSNGGMVCGDCKDVCDPPYFDS